MTTVRFCSGSASSSCTSGANAEPSARAPVDGAPEYMDVDLRGDDDDDDGGGGDDDDDQMEVGLIEDHCIHWYQQSKAIGMSLHLKTLWK